MLEIIIFFILGIFLGLVFGLIPGLHPNTIILLVPLFSTFNIEPLNLIVFVVSLSIVNSIVNFIPTALFCSPDEGTELSVSHLQKFLLSGQAYKAIQLCVIGSFFGIIFCIALIPFLYITLPILFNFIKSYIYIPLIFVCLLMILREKRIFIGIICFLFAGAIGILISGLGINPVVILFPVLSGLFGVSLLLIQIKNKVTIPKQELEIVNIGKNHLSDSIKGTLGGILSGFLPGVGTSQVASFFSSKTSESFLLKIGALNSSNLLLSMLMLWLINKPRSGAAVFLDSLIKINFNEFLSIIFVSLASLFFAVSLTLFLSKFFIKFVRRFNYSLIALSIIVFIITMTYLFSGVVGIVLLATCTSLGIYANLSKINMSLLMAVLIVPVIVFYVI